MGALFLVDARDRGFAEAALAAARPRFAGAAEAELPGWRLLHAPHILGGPDSLLRRGDDFAAVAGTLAVDGEIGRPALEALLADLPLPAPDWTRLGGQFAAFVRRGGRAFLLGDYFGAFQLFHDAERRIFSTSFLAIAEALPRLSFDPQAVYEFAFNVVPIGDDTVFREIRLLPPNEAIELTADGPKVHPLAKPLPEQANDLPVEERIATHRERLAEVVSAHVRPFGDNVVCPLSGGLDSRLLLAALRREGVRPRVYVYGRPGSEDVEIACRIGAAEGFEVRWTDKEARSLDPDAFPGQVERNFQDYDGLPVDGEIFDNGANAAARDARHDDGALAASGGCGEVYRNFFYLPDRPATAARIARTFFARYDRRDTAAAFDEPAFLRALEDKILAALGRPGDRSALPRTLVEQIYPRVRCRAFFGREISLEGRYGAYLMPFLDHRLVAEALTLPMRLKHCGRFEARLMAAIDPALARHPSAYGHDFAGEPGLRHRFGEWSSRIRPAWLRQRSYALRRRLKPGRAEGLLAPDSLARILDLDFPAMRRFFRPARLWEDPALLQRVANLEYLAARLGSRIRG